MACNTCLFPHARVPDFAMIHQRSAFKDTLHKRKKGEFHYIQQLPSPIKNNKISKTFNRDKSSSYDGDLHAISSYLDTKTILSRTVFSGETPLNKGDFLSHVYLTQCSTCSSTVINFTYHKS